MSFSSSSSSSSSERYDRQIRIWGEHGQVRLQEAHVCMVGCGATATEILKNLVLPGIGAFTLVDDALVTRGDLANSFFFTPDSLGEARAVVASRLLCELNNSVRGNPVVGNVDELLDEGGATTLPYFGQFSCVVVASRSAQVVRRLAANLLEIGTPMFWARSFGFVGVHRAVLCEHFVVDSKPDFARADLRVGAQWPALRRHVDNVLGERSLCDIERHELARVPYVVLLVRLAELWRRERGDDARPARTDEFARFIDERVGAERRDCENVAEARDAAFHAFRRAGDDVPDELAAMFACDRCAQLTRDSAPHWIVVRAIDEFRRAHGGSLPLSGAIPDMASDTRSYIALQRLYRDKASDDVDDVLERVGRLLDDLERPRADIARPLVASLCKNVRALAAPPFVSIDEEYRVESPSPRVASSLRNALATFAFDDDGGDDEEEAAAAPLSDAAWYLVVRAADAFCQEHGRWPGVDGCDDGQFGDDTRRLLAECAKLIERYGIDASPDSLEAHARELCRYGDAELHSVAAFMGGLTALEVIKTVTQQFVPATSAFVYNSIRSTSLTLTFTDDE
jgi:NEDD8-activating enzyme E1 regulatory subunit